MSRYSEDRQVIHGGWRGFRKQPRPRCDPLEDSEDLPRTGFGISRTDRGRWDPPRRPVSGRGRIGAKSAMLGELAEAGVLSRFSEESAEAGVLSRSLKESMCKIRTPFR